jgi:hypothetical protein
MLAGEYIKRHRMKDLTPEKYKYGECPSFFICIIGD